MFKGDESVLAVVDKIIEIASRRPVLELAFDPWRFQSEALRLQRDHRLEVVAIPMSTTRMGQMSETLHSAILSRRLVHPNHQVLNVHAANAVAVQTPRGWRLAKSSDDRPIDLLIALAEAVERADQHSEKPEPALLAVI